MSEQPPKIPPEMEKLCTTPELRTAAEDLIRSVTSLSKAQMDTWAQAGGIDLAQTAMATQLFTVQFDSMLQVLIESGAIDRAHYWKVCAGKMLLAEKGLKEQRKNAPRIMVAPPPTGKGN